MRRAAALPLALLLALPACTISKEYIRDRVNDATDVVRVHLIVGKAFGIEAQVTQWLALGFMYEDDCWAGGWANRDMTTWDETISAWGLFLHDWEEKVKGMKYYSGSYGWFLRGGGPDFWRNGPSMDVLNLRASVAVIIGADAEIRTLEIFDFAVGFLTFDPSGDDGK